MLLNFANSSGFEFLTECKSANNFLFQVGSARADRKWFFIIFQRKTDFGSFFELAFFDVFFIIPKDCQNLDVLWWILSKPHGFFTNPNPVWAVFDVGFNGHDKEFL